MHSLRSRCSESAPLDTVRASRILIIVLNFICSRSRIMVTEKSEPTSRVSVDETRCECGQLIAKVRDRGLELKCKRCKRIVMIPFSSIEGWTAPSG